MAGSSVANASADELAGICNYITQVSDKKYLSDEDAIEDYRDFNKMLLIHFPEVCVGEILKAYNMVVKGVLFGSDGKRIVLYQELSFKKTTEIVHAYRDFFKKKFSMHLKNQAFWKNDKEVVDKNPSQKEAEFQEYLNDALSVVRGGGVYAKFGLYQYVYSHLRRNKEISLSKEERELWWGRAKLEVEKDVKNGKSRKGKNFKQLLESIRSSELDSDNLIIDKAKLLILNNYLKQKVTYE